MPKLYRAISICFAAFLLVALGGCGNQYHDKVIGTWETDMPFSPKLTFAKDGSGNMVVNAMGQSVSKSFRWRLNGSNLILTMDGKDSGGVIKSADENKIILNDPDAKKDFIFKRAK